MEQSKNNKDTDEPVYYHIWFGTKRRKWLLQGEVEDKIKELIREIAKQKDINLLACETMVDHMHLLLKSTPADLPKSMKFLKGISSRRVFEAFPDLKLDAETNRFWQEHYGCKVIPFESINTIISYISTQKERPEKLESFSKFD